MDLANYDLSAKAEAGSEVKILDPKSGEPTDIVITVVGSDSKTYRNAVALAAYEHKMGGDDDSEMLERLETVISRQYSTLAACTTGWEGIELDGETLEFSRENALKLYSRFDWISQDVFVHIKNRENFT